jgi:hypothetical protein
MDPFRKMKILQGFASVHGTVHDHFNQERHLTDRETYKADRSAAWLRGAPSWPEVRRTARHGNRFSSG